jgi:chromosome segregation ATPase
LEAVKADISSLNSQNESISTRLEDVDKIIGEQTEQITKLNTMISDADEELRVQKKQYNTIVDEQRVLSQQLVKRNEELAKLYEQLKLQSSSLKQSSALYKKKQGELGKESMTQCFRSPPLHRPFSFFLQPPTPRS